MPIGVQLIAPPWREDLAFRAAALLERAGVVRGTPATGPGALMEIDDPATRAEVEATFAAYERALIANDLDALDALFWQSGFTVRIGPGQNLYGIEAIQAFRKARPGGSPQRELIAVAITTFGRDFAIANAEFRRAGAPAPGRQSQTWVRFDEGWRVVSAHVSMLAEGH